MLKSGGLHFRYSLAFKDFTYQSRHTKLNFFFLHASSWNYNLTLIIICSFQYGTPASLNTEAYTERRGRNRKRYSVTTFMSETLLLIVFFLIEVPSPLNTKPMAIARDHGIFPWGRSGIGHNLNERKWRLTPAWHPFILPGLTPLFFVYFFDRFGRLVLVVRFVSFRSFCFDHFGGFACFVLFSCFGCL